jgi:predicted RND superfamily exporter protein
LSVVLHAVAVADSIRPRAVSVSASEGLHSILEADRRILRSLLDTLGLTAGIIWLTLALLWRSPWLALVSLGVNLLPVALVMALAGFLDLPLNSVTVMVAAVALGIAVDDSVHFITHWRGERARNVPSAEAIALTWRIKGRPILATSAALIAVFSLFTLSSFPPVIHFGWLCAAAFGAALVAVLVLLPVVICRPWTART